MWPAWWLYVIIWLPLRQCSTPEESLSAGNFEIFELPDDLQALQDKISVANFSTAGDSRQNSLSGEADIFKLATEWIEYVSASGSPDPVTSSPHDQKVCSELCTPPVPSKNSLPQGVPIISHTATNEKSRYHFPENETETPEVLMRAALAKPRTISPLPNPSNNKQLTTTQMIRVSNPSPTPKIGIDKACSKLRAPPVPSKNSLPQGVPIISHTATNGRSRHHFPEKAPESETDTPEILIGAAPKKLKTPSPLPKPSNNKQPTTTQMTHVPNLFPVPKIGTDTIAFFWKKTARPVLRKVSKTIIPSQPIGHVFHQQDLFGFSLELEERDLTVYHCKNKKITVQVGATSMAIFQHSHELSPLSKKGLCSDESQRRPGLLALIENETQMSVNDDKSLPLTLAVLYFYNGGQNILEKTPKVTEHCMLYDLAVGDLVVVLDRDMFKEKIRDELLSPTGASAERIKRFLSSPTGIAIKLRVRSTGTTNRPAEGQVQQESYPLTLLFNSDILRILPIVDPRSALPVPPFSLSTPPKSGRSIWIQNSIRWELALFLDDWSPNEASGLVFVQRVMYGGDTLSATRPFQFENGQFGFQMDHERFVFLDGLKREMIWQSNPNQDFQRRKHEWPGAPTMEALASAKGVRELGYQLERDGLFVSLATRDSERFVMFQAFGIPQMKAVLLRKRNGEYEKILESGTSLQSSRVQEGDIVSVICSKGHTIPKLSQEWSVEQVTAAISNENRKDHFPIIGALIGEAQRPIKSPNAPSPPAILVVAEEKYGDQLFNDHLPCALSSAPSGFAKEFSATSPTEAVLDQSNIIDLRNSCPNFAVSVSKAPEKEEMRHEFLFAVQETPSEVCDSVGYWYPEVLELEQCETQATNAHETDNSQDFGNVSELHANGEDFFDFFN
jgi:hypothetical protein